MAKERERRQTDMTEIYKFVDWEVPSIEALKDTTAMALRHRIDKGGLMTRREKDWLTDAVNTNTFFKTAVPVQGWCIPFKDVLRRFVVKQYGQWREMWAVDKTAIRNTSYGRIDEIVELAKA